ncbi:hypothetical protein [Kribbella sp. NPDC051770]|uniref:hypothetical protein n=1 Tax=Kribbella sp. NPDC051770 TaxID=3155413 RepID=UPI0034144AC0
MGSLPDWVAAGAAVVAAALVAWQSLETRRSAQASAAAVTTANAALEHSRSSLELLRSSVDVAKSEELHSRTLIIESVRSRMDAASQLLTITADPRPEWPPLEQDTKFPFILQGVDTDHIFHELDDAERWLTLQYRVSIRNDGPRTAVFELPSWRLDKGSPFATIEPSRVYELLPGDSISGWFDIRKTVADWSSMAQARLIGAANAVDSFQFIYSTPMDSGVSDRYIIEVNGVPFFPKWEGGQLNWAIPEDWDPDPNYPALAPTAKVLESARTYWISRSSGQVLPSLESGHD